MYPIVDALKKAAKETLSPMQLNSAEFTYLPAESVKDYPQLPSAAPDLYLINTVGETKKADQTSYVAQFLYTYEDYIKDKEMSSEAYSEPKEEINSGRKLKFYYEIDLDLD